MQEAYLKTERFQTFGCGTRPKGRGMASLIRSNSRRLNLPGGEPFVDDEEEGDEDEEGGEEDSDELFVDKRDEESPAAFWSEENEENLGGHPPLGEAYPRARDFISHFVGDEGEKETNRKNK